MRLCRHLAQNKLHSLRLVNQTSILNYCTRTCEKRTIPDQNGSNPTSFSSPDQPESPEQSRPKTITEKFTESMKIVGAMKSLNRNKNKPYNTEFTNKLLKPIDGYTSRFQYNGYLKKNHWRYYDDNHVSEYGPETEEQNNYRRRKKHKFCILMGFAGGNYYGMQYNESVNTIEDVLLKAMVKNKWILPEHYDKPFLVDFVRGSRTDRGVSAARMNVSLVLPIDVSIEDLSRDLPSDIRVFGMKRTTPKFDARFSCSGRTYSYTLPTMAFSHYNDQTDWKDYRVPAERLQRANEILSLYKGQTNFHNYTVKKLFFDRSSERYIDYIVCSEPFVERDIEFARITVKGSSFMLHQIRKMVGFSLAVIRGVISDDMLQRSLTKEIFNTPTAPGLGLMLERLHYDEYANRFPTHDQLTFEEFDDDVEKFRREQIYPFIVETEINQQSMVEWFEYLMIHSFDAETRQREENRRYKDDPKFDDECGEDKEFVEKLKRYEE